MFRPNGHGRSTLQHFANAVWGTALGALVLVAEERRRQLVFAQQIIENGRRLQAHRAYHAVASSAVLDVGDWYDVGTHCDPITPAKLPSDTDHAAPAHQEWRRVRRKRELAPLTTLSSSSAASKHVAARDTLISPPVTSPASHNPDSNSATSNLSLASPEQELTARPRLSRRYVQHLQNLVAERVSACLLSQSKSSQANGVQEILAYFNQVQREAGQFGFTSPHDCMQALLRADAPQPQALHDMIVSIGQHHMTKCVPPTNSLPREHDDLSDTPSTNKIDDTPTNQDSFASRIRHYLGSKQLGAAYFEFVAFCERASAPIATCVQNAIRELISAYQSAGLFSVVLEVELKTALVLKEWRILYDDLAWVLRLEIPDRFLDLFSGALTSLLDCDRIEEAFQACFVLTDACQAKTISEKQLCDTLLPALVHMNAADDLFKIRPRILDLYQRCLKKSLFETASTVLREARNVPFTRKCTASFIMKSCNMLLKHDRPRDALDLYAATLKESDSLQDLCHTSRHANFFRLALRCEFFTVACDLLQIIRSSRFRVPQQLMESYITALSKELDALASRHNTGSLEDIAQEREAISHAKIVAKDICELAKVQGYASLLEPLHVTLCKLCGPDRDVLEGLVAAYSEENDSTRVIDLVKNYCQVTTPTNANILIGNIFTAGTLPQDALDILMGSFPGSRREVISSLHAQQRFTELLNFFETCGRYKGLDQNESRMVYDGFAREGPPADAERHVQELFSLFPEACTWEHEHNALLRRCWKRTHNLELVVRLFKQMQSGMATATATDDPRLHRTLAHIHLWAKRPAEARRILEKLDQCGPPDRFTLPLYLLTAALEQNWTLVQETLYSAQQHGHLKWFIRKHSNFLDEIFEQFCHQHLAARCVDCAVDLVKEFNIDITHMTGIYIVERIVHDEDSEALARWHDFVQTHGFPFIVSDKALSLLVHRVSQTKAHKLLVDSSRSHVLDNFRSAESFLDLLLSLRQTYSKAPPALDAPSKQTTFQILSLISAEQREKAVALYQKSLSQKLPHRAVDLAVAIKACATPDMYENMPLLVNDAKDAELSLDGVQAAFAMVQLQQESELTADRARSICFDFYRTVDYANLRLTHRVTLAAARKLAEQQQTRAALQLLSAVEQSDWGRRLPFGITSMTMCLRLFADVGSVDGYKALARSVLDKNLRIDQRFILAMSSGRSRLKQRREGVTEPVLKELEELGEECIERRARQRFHTFQFGQQTVRLMSNPETSPLRVRSRPVAHSTTSW